MKIKYRFAELSPMEQEFWQIVLLEEIEMQTWYVITYSHMLSEELFLTVQ